ncbi:MAG: flavin reductase [Planctomycetota bacterium]|nr:flavin reductase [Planctomycetota bacterium]
MAGFREIAAKDFSINPFRRIGEEWMLIAAEKQDGRVNAMTAAWGGLGFMWRRNAAFIVIRPQRFTKEFVDEASVFSLNFFGPGRRGELNYFGSVSGRDEDKVAKTGFHVERTDCAPYFAESELVLICRKLYAQPYGGEYFIDTTRIDECYPDGDFHTLYVGEVIRILEKA